jgi:hypothetical protein
MIDRNPSHFGSNRRSPAGGIALIDLASIGGTGGMTGSCIDLIIPWARTVPVICRHGTRCADRDGGGRHRRFSADEGSIGAADGQASRERS